MKLLQKLLLLLPCACCSTALQGKDYYTTFAKGQWDESLWFAAKSHRFNYMGTMVQFDDHIMNKVPDLPDDVIFKKYASSVYSCIMMHQKYQMPSDISCTMSFDHRMAPLIVLAKNMGKSKKGEAEQREHYEIVLYDEGINVWHHYYKDNKPIYRRAAFLNAKFLPRKKYNLQVRVRKDRKGKYMEVECDGQKFGFMDESLPETYYVGIIGCEGRNRFYDFGIRTPEEKKK